MMLIFNNDFYPDSEGGNWIPCSAQYNFLKAKKTTRSHAHLPLWEASISPSSMFSLLRWLSPYNQRRTHSHILLAFSSLSLSLSVLLLRPANMSSIVQVWNLSSSLKIYFLDFGFAFQSPLFCIDVLLGFHQVAGHDHSLWDRRQNFFCSCG